MSNFLTLLGHPVQNPSLDVMQKHLTDGYTCGLF